MGGVGGDSLGGVHGDRVAVGDVLADIAAVEDDAGAVLKVRSSSSTADCLSVSTRWLMSGSTSPIQCAICPAAAQRTSG